MDETIQMKGEDGQLVEGVVLTKRADRIEVVIAQTLRCVLTPTRTGRVYAGSIRGRELVYERSRAEVEADLAKRDRNQRGFR